MREKGFAPLLVLVGILILVSISGGIYSLMTTKNIKPEQISATANKQNISKLTQNPSPTLKTKTLSTSNYDVSQIKEYLTLEEQKGIASLEWVLARKEKKQILLTNFSNNEKQINFLEEPSDYNLDYNCSSPEEGVSFFMYSYTLSSIPSDYLKNFDHTENVCIPKTCSNNLNNISAKCICDLSVKYLAKAINERFDAILNENLNWVTEDLKKETVKVAEEFQNMSSSCTTHEIYIYSYKSKNGDSLDVAVSLDDKIMGILIFSPVLY